MASTKPPALIINGGSSSIKFAVFEPSDLLRRIPGGAIARTGRPQATLEAKGAVPADHASQAVNAPDHAAVRAARCLQVQLDLQKTEASADPLPDDRHASLISTDTGRVKVCVINTDEELLIAKSAARVRHLHRGNPKP